MAYLTFSLGSVMYIKADAMIRLEFLGKKIILF